MVYLIFDIASKNDIFLKIKKIGIPNIFLTNYGKPEQHRHSIGLTEEKIKEILNG